MASSTVLTRLLTLYPHAKKTTLRSMLESRRVWINGIPARSLKQPLADSDSFQVVDSAAAPQSKRDQTPLAQGLRLVHFDADLVIVDKPPGLLTSTDAQEKRPTAWRILSDYFANINSKNKIHLIHRLDKDASGLLVFARTQDAYTSLKKQFFEHTITRQYDAIVHGIPKQKSAKLEHLLLEDPLTGIVRIITDLKSGGAGKLAILNYQVIAANPRRKIAHLQCQLFTGRKHQIRAQLKAINHPLCADPLYGTPLTPEEPPHRLALHASLLAFSHPRNGRPAKFHSPMPASFSAILT